MGTESKILSAWTAAWILVDGHIACAKCGERQPITDAEGKFRHAVDCPADEHPWVRLHDELDRQRG
jgi:hypothetical protein